MKIIAVYHMKGGVGKTAAAVNLSYLAAAEGAKTLVCDLDPQSSATYYFRIKPKVKGGVKGLVKGGKRLEASIKGTDYERLDLLPADFSYRNLDLSLDRVKRSRKRLQEALQSVWGEYEYIFLDCPPNITIVAENIFRAADILLIPVVPTTLSVRSFEQLLRFFKKKKYAAHKISVFFSMVERRKKLHSETMTGMSQGMKVILKSHIPYRSEVERMGIHREPLPAFSPKSVATAAYRKLWRELREQL